MIHQSTKSKVFDKLIASLEGAQGGSRELDIIISFMLGDTSTDAGKMIQLLVEEGYSWSVVSELLDEDLPPYTSALDAAVPEENIVLALHSPRRAKWAAVHQKPDGEQVLVWAASEALARRIAALKATRGSAKSAGVTAPGRPADALPTAPKKPAPVGPDPVAPARTWTEPATTEDEEQEAESEWKILV